MKKILFCTTALALLTPAIVRAQETSPPAANPAPPEVASDIIVTGTRLQTGMHAADSPAPIQIVGQQAIQSVGQQDLNQVLAQSLPSLNFESGGGDTANMTLTVALRGVSPNDTMVLINGKRRHTTANLAVLAGSAYSGAATTDLSFVPLAAIDHVEVLQDGAAAQYGSDAIAGVVNIILKKADHGGSLVVTDGQNYEHGGQNVAVSGNIGAKLGEKGFINLTGEYKFHDYTQHGTCDRRYYTSDCTIKSGLSSVVSAGLKANSASPNLNKINGDARYSLFNLFVNAGYDFSDSLQAYATGSYGNRVAKSYENYRSATKVSGTTSTGETVYPLAQGFSPQESIREEDFAMAGGLKGEVAAWNFDGSLSYGRDAVALYTLDSANPSLFSDEQSASATALTGLQRNFYDGTLINDEWVASLDLTHEFNVGFSKPLTLALGGQYRKNDYTIKQGEYSSYYSGGAQSYPGFSPSDEGSWGRHNWAAYIDAAFDPVRALHVDVAGRFENYSDFGSVLTGKATARYDFSDAFALRGTVSNGFRAPTLAEEYYSAVNVGPGSTFGQLPANSAAAQLLGFSKLKPEKSMNYSAGLVAHPAPAVQITIDAYQIKIRDRIISSTVYGSEGTAVVSQAVLDALHSRGVSTADATSYSGVNVFNNGADTRTRGIEATASYVSDFDFGRIDWSVGVNYNKTVITSEGSVPSAVFNATYNTSLLNQTARDSLTTATPREKMILNALWTHGKWSVNLRETIYGKASEHVSPDGSGTGSDAVLLKSPVTGITDLDVGYKITKAIRLDAGANNLFDRQAITTPTTASGRPANGNVYNAAASFTPWGINGGYWYVKAALAF